VAAALPLGADFRRIWSASLLSNLSDGVRAAAFPLLAATLTRDPVLVAGVAVAQQVPWIVAGPVAGVVADRVDRRTLLWTVNTIRAGIFGLLTITIVLGEPSLVMLYLASVALGVGESLYDNAAQSIVPGLVDRSQLERANGRLVTAEIVGNEFAGPPLGALLFGLAVALPFASSSVGLLVAVVLVVGLVGSFRAVPSGDVDRPERVWDQLMEGISFVRRQRDLATVTVLAGVLSIADAAWFAILVLYSLEVLGLSEFGFGVLLAVGAIGGVLGATTTARLSTRLSTRTLLAGSLALSALSQLGLGISTSAEVAIVLIGVSSLAFGIWNVVVVSLRQRVSPDHLLGRVNATYRSVAMGGAPVGALLGGLAASQWGIRAPFLLGVPALVLGAIVAARRLSPGRAHEQG
jgi:predicted MFS family arabinose efflux permease